jgi:bacteriorhodopsin
MSQEWLATTPAYFALIGRLASVPTRSLILGVATDIVMILTGFLGSLHLGVTRYVNAVFIFISFATHVYGPSPSYYVIVINRFAGLWFC